VRELAHVLERALILSGGGTIQDRHLPIAVRQEATPPPRETSDAESLRGMEIEHIERVLAHHNGNRQKTAAALGIGERTLYRRLREGRGQGAETPEEQVCEES